MLPIRLAASLLLLLAVTLDVRPARAEAWGSTMGALLKDARRIEIVDVSAVTADAFDGTIAAAVRTTRKAGDAVRITPGPWMPALAVAKGDRVLVVCDDLCPRALGIERDGAFTVVAQQPGDGASVFPDLVARTSVALLAAGSAAPPLCVRGSFELVDEATRGAFQVSLDAADGRGRGTLEGTAVDASRMFDDLSLRSPAGGSLQLHRDGAIARERDGCYAAMFSLTGPLPRTRAGLARALAGKLAPSPLARGTLGTGRGARAFELLLDADGQLVLAGDLGEGRGFGMQSSPGGAMLYFKLKPAASRPGTFLVVELGTSGAPLATAKHLRTARAPSARLTTRLETASDDPAKATLLGTVALTYVPER